MDDLHIRGILPIVYLRGFPATWSASIHSVGQRSQVYDIFLVEFPKGHEDTIDDEHNVSSVDRWLVGEDHTGFRGLATRMCPRS